MATAPCPFPDNGGVPWANTWDHATRVLRHAPQLQAVRTWRLWTGDANDAAEDLDDPQPDVKLLPWVRVTPMPGASFMQDIGAHESPLFLKIETAIAGTRARDGMLLFNAVVRALWPQDLATRGAFEAAWKSAGCYARKLHAPGFGVKPVGDNVKAQFGSGLVECKIRVLT